MASAVVIRRTKTSGPVISLIATVKVAFDDVLFTCCPPAPPERAKLQCNEALGTTRPLEVRRSSSGFTLASLAQVLSG